MNKFEPPKDSPWLISLAKFIWPAIMKMRHIDIQVKISDASLKKFRALKDQRVIICPNHPHFDDPDILFSFSRTTGEDFNYLTAWEIFQSHRKQKRWLRFFGCYSVIRGSSDHASFKTTKNLLVSGKRKIVIFPEGEVSHENNTLLPLKAGVVQISFAALEELDKASKLAPIFIEPLILKYIYRTNIYHNLISAINHLERHFGIVSDQSQEFRIRVLQIAKANLVVLEKEYSIQSSEDLSFDQRIDQLRLAILEKCAAQLRVELPPEQTQLNWAHWLQSILYGIRYGKREKRNGYRNWQLQALSKDLHRVTNYISASEKYIINAATQEQFAEIIDLLEEEAFRHRSVKGSRYVLIEVGDPINLLKYFEQYKSNRAETIQKIAELISARMHSMLQTLEVSRKPFYVTQSTSHKNVG